MLQSNKILLCHHLLLLLAAEAHYCISGYPSRWSGCIPELALTMNGQPLGSTGHAAKASTGNVVIAVDCGLISNTHKARSAGHNGMIDVPAVPVGPGVEPCPYDWKEHDARYGVARSAEPNGMIAVLAVPEGLQAESRLRAYDRPDHAVLLTRYGLARPVGHDGMTVVSVVEAAEEEGPFAHGEHAVQLSRDGTQRLVGLNGTVAMSVPAGTDAGSFACRREHDVLHDGRWHTNEQAATGLASVVPLVWVSQIPWSTIRAVQGDATDVTVNNSPLTELAMQWHGILQIGTPWADGTESVVQFPFPPRDTFTYRLVVDQQGAYTRHAHHGLQRSLGLNLNGMTFVAVPACQAKPFAYGREHTDVHLTLEDTRRTAGSDNGISAVLVPGRAEDETLACDCDYPVVSIDECWNWHAQVAAGVPAVPSVLVGEPQMSLSYSVRASVNCSLLAFGIRDATRLDCSSSVPFTVVPGKTYHIVTSSGLLFDRTVQLSTAGLIALIMIVQQVGRPYIYQRKKNGGGRHAPVAMALLILLLVIAALPAPSMAAAPGGPVAAAPGLMPESKAAAGRKLACTHDPNYKQDPHRCGPPHH